MEVTDTAAAIIIRLSQLHELALKTFADEQLASKFLLSAHPLLDGQSPFHAAFTEAGGKSVEVIIRSALNGHPL